MCGIIGIFNHDNAASLAALGMFAEQHRGQESCGMAVSNGRLIRLHKRMGLVKDVFQPELIEKLDGKIAIGHVRYPTKGSATEYNSQPHIVETLAGPSYALASNGDIINYQEVRNELESAGVFFSSENDGELILKYIAYQVEKRDLGIVDAIKSMMLRIKGAYSTVMATKEEMYMFRDPYAIRPMVWGIRSDGTVVVASESCALDILEVENRYEVPSAGIIRVTGKGIENIPNDPNLYRSIQSNKHCIFEQIYFSRPDSFHFGENVYTVRERIGRKLAESDTECKPDHAIPVPDSSNFIGLGYANGKKLPFGLGLIRNHYVGRTFIKPEQTIRDESVRQKFNPLPNFFPGRKVVLIDDSIVRGTTIRKIVKMLKDAGAVEVHLRIGSPRVTHSCFYGIDTPNESDLIANQKSLEEIQAHCGADSLKYISLEELQDCVTEPGEYCYACFNGQYPVK